MLSISIKYNSSGLPQNVIYYMSNAPLLFPLLNADKAQWWLNWSLFSELSPSIGGSVRFQCYLIFIIINRTSSLRKFGWKRECTKKNTIRKKPRKGKNYTTLIQLNIGYIVYHCFYDIISFFVQYHIIIFTLYCIVWFLFKYIPSILEPRVLLGNTSLWIRENESELN
jgi:hypothetical protein